MPVSRLRWAAAVLAVITLSSAAGPAGAQIDARCSFASFPRNLDSLAFVFFDLNSVRISRQAVAVLDNFISARAEIPQCPIQIGAHTDRSGTAEYNLTLSRRRAEAVSAYLRRHGLTSEIRIIGYGETRPLVETPDGVREPQNRRAELWMIPSDQPGAGGK